MKKHIGSGNKAESLVINSVGQRPMKCNANERQALPRTSCKAQVKGRNQPYHP